MKEKRKKFFQIQYYRCLARGKKKGLYNAHLKFVGVRAKRIYTDKYVYVKFLSLKGVKIRDLYSINARRLVQNRFIHAITRTYIIAYQFFVRNFRITF